MSEPVTRLRFRVSPGAERSGVVGRHSDAWKLRIAAPPEGGRANHSLQRYLSQLLAVDHGDLRILTGASGRDKLVEVRGCDPACAEALLVAAAGEREGGRRER